MLHDAVVETEGVLRPTHLTVHLDRLRANYRAIQAHVGGAAVMGILKANAYGHGLAEVGRLLEAEGCPYLGVAYLEEGLLLRRAGVKAPVLVLGGIIGEQIPLFLRHGLTLAASSVDKLRAIDAAAGAMGVRAKVHLKIDTGMERIGVHWYSAGPLLEASLVCEHVDVEGVFSHFANADAAERHTTETQIGRFDEILSFWDRRGLPRPMAHLSNSGGILQYPQARYDMVRAGVLLYGAHPSQEVTVRLPVQPAMTWSSRVVYFKVVKAGNPVSYGGLWTPDHDVRVVTVPVGYGDGYARAMTGQAEVSLHGRRYPVVGRICMDQILVNLDRGEAYNGDEVVLMGGEGESAISPEELARWAGTIPHDVLVSINTRVPRVYVDGDAPVSPSGDRL